MPWKNVDPIIENRLFLGNLVAARAPRSLSERRISHIVSVCTEPIPADSPASGIRQLRIPIEDIDYADLLIHLPAACQFIHQALSEGGVVLVHCEQGLSRSAAVVAAYLMYSRRVRATEALEIVRRGERARLVSKCGRTLDFKSSWFCSNYASTIQHHRTEYIEIGAAELKPRFEKEEYNRLLRIVAQILTAPTSAEEK